MTGMYVELPTLRGEGEAGRRTQTLGRHHDMAKRGGHYGPLEASRSDAQLLHDTHDPEASFEEFYERHFQAIMRFVASRSGGTDGAGRHTLDLDTAADVVSETFMSALKYRRRYREEYPTARLWLLKIATNKLIDVKRRQALDVKRHKLLHESFTFSEADHFEFEQQVAQHEEPALAALGDLTPAHRKLIEQRVIEDRAYAEIAVELGLSEAAVRKRVSRGLGVIRRQLTDKT